MYDITVVTRCTPISHDSKDRLNRSSDKHYSYGNIGPYGYSGYYLLKVVHGKTTSELVPGGAQVSLTVTGRKGFLGGAAVEQISEGFNAGYDQQCITAWCVWDCIDAD